GRAAAGPGAQAALVEPGAVERLEEAPLPGVGHFDGSRAALEVDPADEAAVEPALLGDEAEHVRLGGAGRQGFEVEQGHKRLRRTGRVSPLVDGAPGGVSPRRAGRVTSAASSRSG